MEEEDLSVEQICEKLLFLKNVEPGSGISGTDFVLKQLDHEEAKVREKAAECAWEWPGREIADKLLKLARNDPDHSVRRRAIKSLGWYMHYGEDNMYEEAISPGEWIEETLKLEQYKEIRDFLLDVHRDQKKRSFDERRYALEALSFVYREDILNYIEEAYQSDAKEMVISSLFAMGRSGLSQWKDKILESLHSDNDKIQFEAIRACGNCSIDEARPEIIRICKSTDDRMVLKESLLSLASLGEPTMFEFFDNLEAELPMKLEQDFIEYVREEWRFNSQLRKDNW